MVQEVITTEVTTVVVQEGGHKHRRMKSRSHSSCSSCTTCARRHGKQKRVHAKAHSHKAKTKARRTSSSLKGIAVAGDAVVASDGHGHGYVKQEFVAVVADGSDLEFTRDVVVTAVVKDKKGHDIAVEQHRHISVDIDEHGRKGDAHIVNEYTIANSSSEEVHVREETHMDRDSSGDLEIHTEKQTLIEDGSDYIMTKEVTDVQVERTSSFSSSDKRKVVQPKHKPHDTVVIETVVHGGPRVRSRSSCSSEETVILMKKLERKLKKKKVHTPHGHQSGHVQQQSSHRNQAPAHGRKSSHRQVKTRNVSISSSDEVIIITETEYQETDYKRSNNKKAHKSDAHHKQDSHHGLFSCFYV